MPALTLQQFTDRLLADSHYLPPDATDYIRTHSLRFYDTFRTCAQYLKRGDKVLSIGAGIGSIEKMLKEELGVEMTLIDFPETLADFKDYFDRMGFIGVPANLAASQLDLPKAYYNMLLCSEVVEHVPLAPQDQFRKFDSCLATGAKVVITTPNHGSIMHLLKLLMMMPILEPPERTFSEVNAENQVVHRREYFPSELVDSFRKLGYKHVTTRFFFYKKAKNLAHQFLYLLGYLVPRFRYGMIVIGEKP
jgi:2-polyprenyl-3-methyl-5-hydroxy-6-metoxy-1,4-benzoquinol methylase